MSYVVGQVVGGKFGDIVIRQKADTPLEIGELLVSDEDSGAIIVLQVFDLEYASQIQDRVRQMKAGISLDQGVDAAFYEPDLVNYVLARAKQLARIEGPDNIKIPKGLPTFFHKLRPITSRDLDFLKRQNGIHIGEVRSGTKVIDDTSVWLPTEDVFSHHILIPATTGRGKSNLVKVILYRLMDSSNVGVLVLDAHDEYYGRHGPGLKDHPNAKTNLVYYASKNPPPGAHTLTINLESILPEHFAGMLELTEAQERAMTSYYREHGRHWVEALVTGDAEDADAAKATISALRRKIQSALDLDTDEQGNISSGSGVFDPIRGRATIKMIVDSIEAGKVVVLDTSRLTDKAELIVGSVVASHLLRNYRRYKAQGKLHNMPVATIVIEEAPRVIGEEVLASGDNVYVTIAREGRKFKIGLTAVTQLSSVIPKTILANMNTKIILGNELKQERAAVIASSSQDLSDDDRNIASLNKGDAIITSVFVPFAMPIHIPLFEDIISRNDKPARMMVP